ncbi:MULTISPECIES: hypothetical protein [unclassified Paraburkholderia]|uniref:hypothetical protein n=1 Tax=unclassified Paraburkholderia TaxID=2615204 RepID=UPI002AB0B67A|nr:MULTISPECIES: hypothetical protein [unclassified Paraburkholderia]
MSSTIAPPVILMGSWKFRHDIPFDDVDFALRAIEPGNLAVGVATAIADLRGERRMIMQWRDGRAVRSADDFEQCDNLYGRCIPLAIAVLTDSHVEITHLMTRLDTHRATFVRPPHTIVQADHVDGLPAALLDAFRRNRLAVNNWECRYATSEATFETRFDISDLGAPRALGEAWYALLDSSDAEPFVAQSGDAFRLIDHDVTACQEIPTGELWIEHWSRKRKEDFELSLAQVCRVAAHTPHLTDRIEARVEAPFAESAASLVDRPLKAIGSYRRVAFSTECESMRTGHIFTVAFETCVSHDDPAVHTTRGNVCFQKTRGEPDSSSILTELAVLSSIVERFLHTCHLVTEPARPMLAFMQTTAGVDRPIL